MSNYRYVNIATRCNGNGCRGRYHVLYSHAGIEYCYRCYEKLVGTPKTPFQQMKRDFARPKDPNHQNLI